MRICAIQPPYFDDESRWEESFRFITEQLALCTPEDDLIILPEFSNIPSINNRETMLRLAEPNYRLLEDLVCETAVRCGAFVSANYALPGSFGHRNSTLFYSRGGEILHVYNKIHLTYGERELLRLDHSYAKGPGAKPNAVVEADGVRFGFLTCYDMYFNEHIEHLAAQKPDIIILASYQRSERDDILAAQVKLCAARCNAFMIRCSYSIGLDSTVGANTMLADSAGQILQNIGQQTGALRAEIDPSRKHIRSNGHGQAPIPADEFINAGLTPHVYAE